MTASKTPRNAALLPRNPIFVRLHGRAVHVVDNVTTASYDPHGGLGDPALAPHHDESEKPATRPLRDGPADPVGLLLGDVTTRCGRTISRNIGGLNASGSLVADFDDADLCQSCWRTVAAEDQHRLFEHPQADGSDLYPSAGED